MSFPFHLIPHALHALSKVVEDVQRDFDQRREEKIAREWQKGNAAGQKGLAGVSPAFQAQLEQFEQKREQLGQFQPKPGKSEFHPHDAAETERDVGKRHDAAARAPLAEMFQRSRKDQVSLRRRLGQEVVDGSCPRCGETTIAFLPAGAMCLHCGAKVTTLTCAGCDIQFFAMENSWPPKCRVCERAN